MLRQRRRRIDSCVPLSIIDMSVMYGVSSPHPRPHNQATDGPDLTQFNHLSCNYSVFLLCNDQLVIVDN
jgi:hypothetical protein